MAYNTDLSDRIDRVLATHTGYEPRKMFGGLAYLLHGNMAVGVVGDLLMVRVGPDAWEEALTQPHAEPMTFTGRSMRGMVYVTQEGWQDDVTLRAWIERGDRYARAQPPKAPKVAKPRAPRGTAKPRR